MATTKDHSYSDALESDHEPPPEPPIPPDPPELLKKTDTLATTSDSSSNMVMASLHNQPLGHQSGIKTGGNGIFETVLWCNNLDLTFNYGKLFVTFKQFGAIERIKVRITDKS